MQTQSVVPAAGASGSDVWQMAQNLHLDGKLEDAEKIYDQILSQNTAHAGTLGCMAMLYLQMGKPGLSIVLHHLAIDASKREGKRGKPNTLECPSDLLSNLGIAYKQAGLHAQARHWFERAVQMPNPSPESVAHYGATFIEGDNDAAIEYLTKAINQKPDHWIAHWNLALALLSSGQWERGWREHEHGFRTQQRRDRVLGGRPRWRGPKQEPGITVAVYGEQGIGDEIMFASMIHDVLKTNKVVIECHQRLVTLFERAFGPHGVNVYGTREEESPAWPDTEAFDRQISIGSLGQYYRNKRDDFHGNPYLDAEPAPRSSRFRVGISWTGGQKAGRVRKRTVPLSWWKSILDNDAEFISLQYTDADEEIALVNALGYDIAEPAEVKANDYYETAKLVRSCDLIITVCTSVVHLAGALGVPCWVMTPKSPAWRYQNEGPMPWYRSVRLYRKPGTIEESWEPVVAKIGYDLAEMLVERNRQEAVA